jgi:hypothetical protein
VSICMMRNADAEGIVRTATANPMAAYRPRTCRAFPDARTAVGPGGGPPACSPRSGRACPAPRSSRCHPSLQARGIPQQSGAGAKPSKGGLIHVQSMPKTKKGRYGSLSSHQECPSRNATISENLLGDAREINLKNPAYFARSDWVNSTPSRPGPLPIQSRDGPTASALDEHAPDRVSRGRVVLDGLFPAELALGRRH